MVALRTAHGCRGPAANKENILNFIHRLEEAKSKYQKNCILNCDETNWPVIFTKRHVWMLREEGNSQNQEIKAHIKADMKASFTAMALITFS
jgi:hypothetical protein